VSLAFALMAIVALSVAALTLVRTVDLGTLLLGNLAFKQDATAQAERALQQAQTWLQTHATELQEDATAAGYYASHPSGLDPTGRRSDPNRVLIDWAGDGCAGQSSHASCTHRALRAGASGDGTVLRYAIFRWCSQSGPANVGNNVCPQPAGGGGAGNARGQVDYSRYERFTGGAGVYYRVLVRVEGTRQTVSTVEALLHP